MSFVWLHRRPREGGRLLPPLLPPQPSPTSALSTQRSTRSASTSCRRRCPRVSASRSTVDKSYFSKASGRCGPLPPPHIPCTPAQTRAAARPGSRQPIASCTLNPAVDARTCDYMTMNWQLSSAAHAGRTARMEALAVDGMRSYVCVCCMRLLLEC